MSEYRDNLYAALGRADRALLEITRMWPMTLGQPSPTPEETAMNEHGLKIQLAAAEQAKMHSQQPYDPHRNSMAPERQQLAVESAAEELEAHLSQLHGDIMTLAAALQPIRHDTENVTRAANPEPLGRPIMSTPLGNRLRSHSELARQMSAQIRAVLEELR